MDEPCNICDKPLNRAAGWIHRNTSNEMIPADVEITDPWDDLGWFPVGPECIKNIDPKMVRRDF